MPIWLILQSSLLFNQFAQQQVRDLQKLNQSIRSLFEKQIEDVCTFYDLFRI